MRTAITWNRIMHDCGIYKNAETYCMHQESFLNSKKVIGDTGLQGKRRHIILNFNRNQARAFEHREVMNRDIRKQQIHQE